MSENVEAADKEDVGAVWELVYSLVKIITGDVDVKADGNLQSQIKDQKDEIIELKKSSSDGKSSVAAAITAMGVSTAADASLQTIVENIRKIFPTLSQNDNIVSATVNGANKRDLTLQDGTLGNPTVAWNEGTVAIACEVAASGYLAKGAKSTSSAAITTIGAHTVTPGKTAQTAIGFGTRAYFSGNLQVDSLGGNAVAADVIYGKIFSSNAAGRTVTGTCKGVYLGMPDQRRVVSKGSDTIFLFPASSGTSGSSLSITNTTSWVSHGDYILNATGPLVMELRYSVFTGLNLKRAIVKRQHYNSTTVDRTEYYYLENVSAVGTYRFGNNGVCSISFQSGGVIHLELAASTGGWIFDTFSLYALESS